MVLINTYEADDLADAWDVACRTISGADTALRTPGRFLDGWDHLTVVHDATTVTLVMEAVGGDTWEAVAPLPSNSYDRYREFILKPGSRTAILHTSEVPSESGVAVNEIEAWRTALLSHVWGTLRPGGALRFGTRLQFGMASIGTPFVEWQMVVAQFSALVSGTHPTGATREWTNQPNLTFDSVMRVLLLAPSPPGGAGIPSDPNVQNGLFELFAYPGIFASQSSLNDIAALHQFADDLFAAAGTQEGSVRDAHGRMLVDLQTNTPVNPLPDPQFTFDSAFIRLAIAADAYAGGEVQLRLRNGGQIAPACGAMIGKDRKS